MPTRPLIGITLGDPVGIGPEVVAKTLAEPRVLEACRPLVVGNRAVLERASAVADVVLRFVDVDTPEAVPPEGAVGVLDPSGRDGIATLPWGRLSAEAGAAAVDWALGAARLAMEERLDAIATAPLNKAAADLAGYRDVGHMELYQRLAEAPQVATMLMTPGLRVVHLTTHRPLRLAAEAVTREHVLAKLRLTHDFFVRYGYERPRIGVAALNPHGGEDGLLGNEETTAIGPAVADAAAEGIVALGPVPADTVFTQAIDGRYDVVLAMYHDQGHIPVKVHGWAESVTTNLGLPFIRTSVDHGTAFDIAGQGIADATSMVEAVRLAARMALGRLSAG